VPFPHLYIGVTNSIFHLHKLSEPIRKYEKKQVYRKRWGKLFYVASNYRLWLISTVAETFKI